MSEDALADRFASTWCNKLRYVKQWRRWYVWDGSRWREDSTALSCRLAIELVRQACYWPEAMSLTPQERRALDSRRTAWSMLALAGTDRRLAATAERAGVDPPVRWRRKKASLR
jgi:phage/plasmid-associated DNA primase